MRHSVVALLLAGITGANAGPVHHPDVSLLTTNAQVIVVGRVSNALVRHDGDVSSEDFDVTIARALKGDIGPRSVAHVHVDLRGEQRAVERGRYGTFFLEASRPGGYTPVDPWTMFGVATPGERPASATSSTPIAKMADEIAAIFTIRPATLADEDNGLRPRVPPLTPGYPGEDVYAEAFDEIATVDKPAAFAALDKVIPASAYPGRLWALAAAMELGEASQFETVFAAMMQTPPNAIMLGVYLSMALEHTQFSGAQIPALTRLLHATNHFIREAALEVLFRMRTPAVVPAMETVLDGPETNLAKRASGFICMVITSCNGAARVAYFAQPENHAKLRNLVGSWEKSRKP